MSIDARVVANRCGLGGSELPLDGVILVAMPLAIEKLLGRQVQAITFGRTVMISSRVFDRVVAGSEPELLAHELIHVAQWRDHGVAAFAWAYVRDYLRLRLLGATHDAAYRSIGLEYQAFTGARAIAGSHS